MKKVVILMIGMLVLMAGRFPDSYQWKISGIVRNAADRQPLEGVKVSVTGTQQTTQTDHRGWYSIEVKRARETISFSYPGFKTLTLNVAGRQEINVYLQSEKPETLPMEETVEAEIVPDREAKVRPGLPVATGARHTLQVPNDGGIVYNTEEYATIHDNIFHDPVSKPLSTFSIDVDAASYSNLRRFLSSGTRPPKDAIRIEEMINYFNYDYPEPEREEPFSISTELSYAPWNTDHQLVHIGLQGRHIETENLPASNLVFLIDVSGSMRAQNKLPLLKQAYNLLVDNLRPVDRVAIVVYAGAAGTVLESTPGSRKDQIRSAITNLSAGGSTAGGEGIRLAYRIAAEHFIEEGNNRVILATDGDFNVGASSNAEMERLIEEKRKSGVFLTVLGFGMGNYKDSKMEILADKGNGNYAYIDNILEAKKVLVNEFAGTLFTIAKDVKIQVEFNPEYVQAYRLIGYENRLLNDEDFNDDRKDAGEIGSGHSVTALYEIIPAGVESGFLRDIDPLKYQQKPRVKVRTAKDELMTVKVRYKQPDDFDSKLLTRVVHNRPEEDTSDNFRWSAAVAGFGMLLRDSEFSGDTSFDRVRRLAVSAVGDDPDGYRSEFIRMIDSGALTARK